MTTKTRKPAKKPTKRTLVNRTIVKGDVRKSTTKSRKKTASGSTAKQGTVAKVVTRGKRSETQNLIVAWKPEGLKGLGLIQVGDVKKLELRDRLGMTRPVFGRIVNVAERTIAKVESGDETPDKLKRPYNEVYRLWEALSELVDPKSLGHWFQTPNDSFDGLKPIEVIERGEIDRLWDMVFELQTGMPG